MQPKSDELIKHQVGSELKWDTRTWNLDIQVDVSDGVVTLTGVIPSYAQKLAAQDAAHRVQDVLDVANDIIVKIPHERGDEPGGVDQEQEQCPGADDSGHKQGQHRQRQAP